jgi:YVTN family beta-propeller protein
MTRWSFLVFAGLLEILFFSISSGIVFAKSSSEAKSPDQNKTSSSVHVEFFAKPHEIKGNMDPVLKAGKPLKVGFRIKDKDSGYGISDLHPAAWISKRNPTAGKPDQDACKSGIKKFIKGGIINEAYGDLNNFYIISLNADDTISIFNPLVNLATSNLLALIPLKGKAASWVFDETAGNIYVTLPERNEVAVVDINARAIDRYIKVGKNPQQISQQPDGRYIWVGNEGSGTVSAIDRVTRSVSKTFETGKGALNFSFDPKRKWTFISSDDNGKITTIDSKDFKTVSSLSLGKGSYLITYSALSESLFAAEQDSGKVTILYTETEKIAKTLRMPPGVTTLKTTPDGRHVLALHESRNTIAAIDSSDNKIVHVITTLEKPDQIQFSPSFAYIHHAGNVHVSILQLSALAKAGAPPVVDIPIGVELPEKTPGLPGVSLLDITPDEGGALIANPADNTVYLYKEGGMMAPSNSFKTYTSPPLGLFIYDHSLIEGSTTGEYSTSLQVSDGGIYDVFFLLSTPLVSTCFEVKIEGKTGIQQAKLRQLSFVNLIKEETLRSGVLSKIRFHLKDKETSKTLTDIADIRVLAMNQFGSWQVRQKAVSVGDGIYEVQFIFPRKGPYRLMLESPSLGIEFGPVGHTYRIATADQGATGKSNKGAK